jgi:light-regulated signal transduction histidine kinase (bacteriophytochrome)
MAPPASANRAALPPDLSACDLEPIRVPGAVQPHGRLLVLDPSTRRLVAHSDNWPPEAMEAALVGLGELDLRDLPPGAAPVSLGAWGLGDDRWDVSAHRSDRHLLYEFEPARPSEGNEAPIYSLTRIFLPRLQGADSIEQLTQLVATEMKRLTGFGRCLVYRFDDAGHGEVLAEAIDPGYDSYARHHFPAGDIPQQARALYLLNQFRLIADATYTPVPLRITDRTLKPVDIDLSQAQLRSVSPVHLEYMRNMGTLSSMSVSIVIEGRLWGLVSCHDHAPRFIGVSTRLACEHLGQLLALQIQSKESNHSVAERLGLRQLTLQIVSHLADSDETLQRLVLEPSLMLRVARATGAAVVLDDAVWRVGDVPPDADIQALAQWVSGLGDEVYASHTLADHYAPARDFQAVAAGVLAVSISQVHRHVILWFRPEIVKTVTWAGNPRKNAIAADGRIHPRLSFESWQERIRGSAVAWSDAEVGAAGELRQALIGIVLRRAEEMAEVAHELTRVNKELEAFSYTVSHDLRAPMRHIAGYVDLVVDLEGKALSERAMRYLGNVKDAASFAGQLVDALLDFSRMGRASLKRRAVDTQMLVDDLVRELMRQEPGRPVEWTRDATYPSLHADPLLLQVATRNLLSNALKYSRGREPARIAVRAVQTPEGDGLEVEDNGVGFQMKYADKLFGVFQRLHQAEDFEGTGIGLANVKRIVERHGGTVWADGEPGRGARFGFVLPRAAPGADPDIDSPSPTIPGAL